ncbi:hypothetical protein KM481_gp66 [Harp seal herpesvirus]|uniref:Uncharacterized protein n=1 Tax=phocid gammaherpesvirus 3 TaxID=2560643 RepID=A0A0R5ZAP7_9GAMA|nr:hypothetical protein KM481_gp66 [Harp seal herpesvirus]AJG42996.1 hypothetical protein [Harp seal herpesvirus]
MTPALEYPSPPNTPSPTRSFSISSRKTRKSHKSYRAGKKNFHPYKAYSIKSKHKGDIAISNEDFFNGISLNKEFGRDFLREMDTPLCTSKTVCLPLDISEIAPGRCIALSPFGHTANMGFYCDQCCQTLTSAKCHFKQQTPNKLFLGPNDELCSVALSFYNNAEKVVQNKAFYLSLLSNSVHAIKQSFVQPSLLYGYLVLKTMCSDVVPLFTQGENNMLTMYATFKTESLHIGETCLRLLTDNMINYKITIDCIKKTYVIKFFPQHPEEKTPSVPETSICESIASLDFTDELKQELVNGHQIISNF